VPVSGDQLAQQGRDQAVVLVRYGVGHADRIPLVEKVPEVILDVLLIYRAIVPP